MLLVASTDIGTAFLAAKRSAGRMSRKLLALRT
jgi:hypothetical protein